MILDEKRYIGDDVYVQYHSPYIILTTENGIRQTNVIVIEPEVLLRLERFIAQVKEAVR